MMRTLRLSLMGLRRELGGLEVLTLIAALALGTAAMLAVRLLGERIASGFERDAAVWIGGDFGVAGRSPVDPAWGAEARARGLSATRIAQFPSVLFHDESSLMAEIKAVEEGYPLRGTLLVADRPEGPARESDAPPRGAVFAERRLLEALALEIGDRLDFAGASFEIAGVLIAEPDFGGDLFQLAPRLLLRLEDIEDSGLLGPGSRAAWRLMVAGPPEAVGVFREWLKPRLQSHRELAPGDLQRVARTASERAERFLALAAVLAVLFSGVAIALAASQYAARRKDEAAILRCLGAGPRRTAAIYIARLLILALPALLAGTLLGIALETALYRLLGELLPPSPFSAAFAPMLSAGTVALLLLSGFALPALLDLAAVPPQRVLRAESSSPRRVSRSLSLAATLAAFLIVLHSSRETPLALQVGGALAVLLSLASGSGLLLARIARAVSGLTKGPLALGLAALGRRPGLLAAQLAGLSSSLFALLLLAAIGPALLRQWQQALPPETPNWFLLNVQPHQRDAIESALLTAGASSLSLEPFATGRLLSINGRTPRAEDYEDPRASTWIHGPLNLSWRESFPAANRLLSGRFWEEGERRAEASVEKTWAEIFGTRLGDRYRVAIADREYEFEVTSLREADWDSFRVNFFILLHPSVAADAPHQWVASFHLPREQTTALAALGAAYPNLTLIDVEAILERLRATVSRIGEAVKLVLALGLAAGFTVLLAALAATRGERHQEAALLRTLGASRRQLALAALVEHAAIGLIAAIVAAAGAAATGVLLAHFAFSLPAFATPWSVLLMAIPASMVITILAGTIALRGVVSAPPALSLRRG